MKVNRDVRIYIRGFSLCACLLASISCLAQPQTSAEPFSIGKSYRVDSDVLGEERVFHVYEPPYYSASSQKYPVLYVLDGTENFGHIATVVEFLSNYEFIPQMLVVAIANTDRSRDFMTESENPDDKPINPTAGGADDFIRYFSAELIPWVDNNYRANDYRILFGHSAGGFFTIYSMLSNPELFNAYLAASPSAFWNNEQLRRLAEDIDPDEFEGPEKLYVTRGDEGSEWNDLKRLMTAFDGLGKESVAWRFSQMDQEKHLSTPHLTVYNGLKYIFGGWYPGDVLTMYEELGIEGIHNYFEELDQAFDTRRGTPPAVIREMLGRLMEEERFYEVAEILQSDPLKYPTHPNDISRLAMQFEETGDREKARELYAFALRFSPSNQLARQRLSDLDVDVDNLLDDIAPDEAELRQLTGRYRMGNGSIWEIRLVDRGLVVYINDMPNEPVMLSPTSYTLGPNRVFMEFDVNLSSSEATLKVRSSISDWEPTEKLD